MGSPIDLETKKWFQDPNEKDKAALLKIQPLWKEKLLVWTTANLYGNRKGRSAEVVIKNTL